MGKSIEYGYNVINIDQYGSYKKIKLVLGLIQIPGKNL